MNNLTKIVQSHLNEHEKILQKNIQNLTNKIVKASKIILKSLANKGTIFWCGNGGSASDSMHLSAELIGRYKKKRMPLKSISLLSDPASITCISNDFGFEKIFSRQINALAGKGDVLIALSTSGNSKNILEAIKEGKKKSLKVISFLGKNGGKCKGLSDVEININSKSTARIQEMHMLAGHIICDLIEKKI